MSTSLCLIWENYDVNSRRKLLFFNWFSLIWSIHYYSLPQNFRPISVPWLKTLSNLKGTPTAHINHADLFLSKSNGLICSGEFIQVLCWAFETCPSSLTSFPGPYREFLAPQIEVGELFPTSKHLFVRLGIDVEPNSVELVRIQNSYLNRQRESRVDHPTHGELHSGSEQHCCLFRAATPRASKWRKIKYIVSPFRCDSLIRHPRGIRQKMLGVFLNIIVRFFKKSYQLRKHVHFLMPENVQHLSHQ